MSAKPHPSEDASEDGLHYRRFAGEILRARAQALRKRLKKLTAKPDATSVHRTRVAARRLRTAMKLFADTLPPGGPVAWNRPVRRMARRLGDTRDADVQIEQIESILTAGVPRIDRPGLKDVVRGLKDRRRTSARKIAKALRELEASGALRELISACDPGSASAVPDRQADASVVIDAPARAQIARAAAPAIIERLEAMLALSDCVHRPEQVERLHALRIAAKHLRYALEIFAPALGPGVTPAIRAATELQAVLGEVHDADVWLTQLPPSKAVPRAHRPGLESLRAVQAARRQREYLLFVALWNRLEQRGLWERLRQTLHRDAQTGSPGTGSPRAAAPDGPSAARPTASRGRVKAPAKSKTRRS